MVAVRLCVVSMLDEQVKFLLTILHILAFFPLIEFHNKKSCVWFYIEQSNTINSIVIMQEYEF